MDFPTEKGELIYLEQFRFSGVSRKTMKIIDNTFLFPTYFDGLVYCTPEWEYASNYRLSTVKTAKGKPFYQEVIVKENDILFFVTDFKLDKTTVFGDYTKRCFSRHKTNPELFQGHYVVRTVSDLFQGYLGLVNRTNGYIGASAVFNADFQKVSSMLHVEILKKGFIDGGIFLTESSEYIWIPKLFFKLFF